MTSWAGVSCALVQIRLLDEEVLEAAITVQRLQQRRGNLKGLHHKLQVGIVPCYSFFAHCGPHKAD